MPRNGSGIYSLPAGSIVANGETIQPSQHNPPLQDIASDLNTARPISAGGTGATTAAAALINFGVTATAAELNTLDGVSSFTFMPIGMPFPLYVVTGVPTPTLAVTGGPRFVLLSAGQTGAGGWNEGLLGSESVSGSAPFITATATILVGPAAGSIIYLINTMQRYIRPTSTNALELQEHALQGHGHEFPVYQNVTGGSGSIRADTTTANPVLNTTVSIVSDGTNGTPNIANETRPSSFLLPYYMRVL